ncbi:MAG: thioredoxin [Bacilli bacterium]
MIKHLEKEEDFYEIIKEGPIIVDFYADWCGPCKMLLPVLDEIDFATILKVNVDEFPNIAKRFGIMSIPTLLFFKNGLEQNREIGYRGLDEIKEAYKLIS